MSERSSTFMMKKRRRMTKTLTLGCIQADERPRPGGTVDPEILVQVKLSNRELIHSLGISCQSEHTHVVKLVLTHEMFTEFHEHTSKETQRECIHF